MLLEEYEKQEKKKAFWGEAREWIICFVIAYLVYLILNYYFISISGVKQFSMYPTAKENEKVLIQRMKVFKHNLKYGDIVTFEAPIETNDYEMTGNEEDLIADYKEFTGLNKFFFDFMGIGKKNYIKRIIGLPGDHIEIREDGEVYRNDQKLVETYLNDGTTNQSGVYIDLTIPAGTVFVMGDNRLESRDSRYFGCIPLEKVNGLVIFRFWPLNRIGALK